MIVDGFDTNDLNSCRLRIRLAEILQSHGFQYVLQLAKLTDTEILALKGVGKTSLAAIRLEITMLERQRSSLH